MERGIKGATKSIFSNISTIRKRTCRVKLEPDSEALAEHRKRSNISDKGSKIECCYICLVAMIKKNYLPLKQI